jgi:hypothetical protein
MDIKALLGLVASPTILAGVGGWLGYKYGKKASIQNKYIAGGVGLGAGYLLGKTLQGISAPPAAPAAQPVPQVVDPEQPPVGDYLSLNFDAPHALPDPEFDTSPANEYAGEGSYKKTSYNVQKVEDAMDQMEALMQLEKKNGTN